MQIVIRYQCLQALFLKKLYKSLINVAGQFHDFDYNQQNVESYTVYHTLPTNRLKIRLKTWYTESVISFVHTETTRTHTHTDNK